MNTYWLYIEPHTMVFQETNKTLLYNSISGEYHVITNTGVEYDLVKRLLAPPDIYLLRVIEDDILEAPIKDFIRILRNKFLVELIDCRLVNHQPQILYPKLQLMGSVSNLLRDDGSSVGDKVLQYLHKLVVQPIGRCSQACEHCSDCFQQHIVCCKHSEVELSIEAIKDLFSYISNSSVSSVDLIGGELFQYTQLSELNQIISDYHSVNFVLHVCFRQICTIPLDLLLASTSIPNVELRIDCVGDVTLEKLQNLFEMLNTNNISFSIHFMVSSEEDYEKVEKVCTEVEVERYEIKPFFIKKNPEMEELLYIDEEAILSQVHRKKDIFRRQSLNTFDFGSLTFLCNGDVYGNVNHSNLGNILSTNLLSLLEKELSQGESWLRTRNKAPCNDCIYQWLCPSPSNYEIVIGRSNLCSLRS